MDKGYGNWVTIHAVREPDRVALVDGVGGRETTWRELEERTNRLCDALRANGVRKGDRVALFAMNSAAMMEVYFAVGKLGAITVPVNFRLQPAEVAYVLNDSGATFLFVSADLLEVAQQALADSPSVRRTVVIPMLADRANGDEGQYGELLASGSAERLVRDVDDRDVAVIMYTSGTTGLPKGAMLTHRNFFYNAINACGMGSGIGRDDVTISAAPLFHIGALSIHTMPLAFIGGCTVALEAFTAGDWLDAVERHRPTQVFLVPAMWSAVVQDPTIGSRDLGSLTFAMSGGAPCPITIINAMQGYGVAFTEGFGMTETAPLACYLAPEDVLTHAGSIGRPFNLVELQVVGEDGRQMPTGEVGELAIRGENVFVGYWDKPTETAQALRGGWLFSGDLAYVDAEGYYTLVDRKKDMIITGGENVYPVEVEQVMYQHPAVGEVAVIGLPDEKWGEAVVAVVAVKPGAELDVEQLREWTRERIAHYKAPKEIRLIDELPRNATGKILKRELRQSQGGTATSVTR